MSSQPAWRMAQGVTMMMKVRETAERDLTRLARMSASTESLIGLLAAWLPSNIGRARHRAVLQSIQSTDGFLVFLCTSRSHLFFILSFCEW